MNTNTNNLKNQLVAYLKKNEKLARLLGLSICRNSGTLDNVCGDSDVKQCKAMANELITDVLTINYKFEKCLVDAIMRALSTSASYTIEFKERRSNFFNSICKIISSKCADMIDSNMKKCSHIVNRYSDIENEVMFKIFVYAILVQYLDDIEMLNKIRKRSLGQPNSLHFELDREEEPKKQIVLGVCNYEKTSLSNKEHTKQVTEETNSESILLEGDEPLQLPETSDTLKDKTAVNSSVDETQAGDYKPNDSVEETHTDENNDKDEKSSVLNMTSQEIMEGINELVDNLQDKLSRSVMLASVRDIIIKSIDKTPRKELIQFACRDLPNEYIINPSVVGEYILACTTIINLIYKNKDEIVDDTVTYLKLLLKVLDGIIKKEAKSSKSNKKNRDTGKSTPKPSKNTTSSTKSDNINFSKIVNSYKGKVDLSKKADELCRELESINALDIIDETVEKLQITTDELVYVLFVMRNKSLLADKIRKQVYSVLINCVIANHKNKNRIMTAVVDTILTNKGTHSVSNLYPYKSTTKVNTIDKIIDMSVSLMKCKVGDIAC